MIKKHESYLLGLREVFETLGCCHLANIDVLREFQYPDEDKNELDQFEYLRGKVEAHQEILQSLLDWRKNAKM